MQAIQSVSKIPFDFFYGATLPLRAAWLILKNPSLLVLSILPVMLTFFLYWFSLPQIMEWSDLWLTGWFQGRGLETSGILLQTVQWIAAIGLLFFSVLTFAYVAILLATPLNDFLAERTEKFAQPPLPPLDAPTLKQRFSLIWTDLVKTIFCMGLSLIALLFSWIPILNVFAFVMITLLISLQFLSYPQTRRGMGVKTSIAFTLRSFSSSFGFGLATTFLMAIPMASPLVLPLAVVGGTMLFAKKTDPLASKIEPIQVMS